MRNLTNISNDQVSKPKSVLDMTPFELSEIDNFQNKNRGFEDNSDEDFRGYPFDAEEDFFDGY